MITASADNRNRRLIRLGGLCGIIGSAFTIIMVFAATILSPWFQWDTNALSELGVGEVSLLFNSAVIIGGILFFFFALGIREHLSGGRSARAGTILVMFSAISLALVGVFTLEYPTLHGIVSLCYFVLAPVGFILIGFGTKENRLKKLSIGTGMVALVMILILPLILLTFPFKIGFAVPEMAEALIMSAWLLFMGVRLLNDKH